MHDHQGYGSVETVRAQAALITARVSANQMPLGTTMAPRARQRLLQFVACGAPSSPTPDAGTTFQAISARAAVAKVKGFLTGLPPTDSEVAAVAQDPNALKGLIDTWMAQPQYAEKMRVFLQLAFQQTQITSADFEDFFQIAAAPAMSMLVENAKESFARTVLAIDAEGRPFTEVLATRRLMMTPALMELYAFMDARRLDNTGRAVDTLQLPGKTITITATGSPIPLTQSLNPSSPNFLKFFNAAIGTLNYPDPSCNTDPVVIPATSLGIHSVLHGIIPYQPRKGKPDCPSRSTGIAGLQFDPTDFSTWKMVTIRRPTGTESTSRSYDVTGFRTASQLVLATPKIGFFSTPAFHANWPTNDSNQMRVTVNQAMIVATGRQFDGLDVTPSPLTPGLDTEHSSTAECSSCHRLLDPTRSILSSSWSWFYYPQTSAPVASEKGRFIFQGVDKAVGSLDEFADTLANHPLVPTAWTQKLCTAANSGRCPENDAEFKRVVAAFVSSNYRWSTLVRELLSSPLVTRLSATGSSNAEIVGVARRDQLCAMIDARLNLKDACGRTLSLGARAAGIGIIPRIASGLPSDGYGRGGTEPILPNTPTLFYRAALENVCSDLANVVIDGPALPDQPNVKRWSSTQANQAIGEFVSLIVGLTADDPRRATVTDALKKHFGDASKTQTPANALKSTFIAACLSPTFIGVGL
jgi:hypothetical protein